MDRVNKCTDTTNFNETDFSDLLTKYNLNSDSTIDRPNGYDSDDPFEELITRPCKNITTTPSTPFNIFEIHNELSSSKNVSHRSIAISKPKTPPKAYVNATSTPRMLDEHSEQFDLVSSESNLESNIGLLSSFTLSSPLSSVMFQNSSTPKPDKTTPRPISSLKKYSLMKAAVAAKKDCENILKTVELNQSSLKNDRNKADCNLSPYPFDNGRTPTLNCKTYGSISSKNGKLRSIPSSCPPSLLNEPSDPNKTITTLIQHSNQTPLSTKAKAKYGKSFDASFFKKTPAGVYNKNLSTLLRGIVAYVEIRSTFDKKYWNSGTIAELESLGAKTQKTLTKKVTHCFFHWGKMSTYCKAIDLKVPLVSMLWIEECKEKKEMVPIKGFEPFGLDKYKENLLSYRLRVRSSNTKIRRPVTGNKLTAKPWEAKDATNTTVGITANQDLGSIKKGKGSEKSEILFPQAVSVGCSTPSRQLPSRKCKKLMFSCSKPQNPKENDKAVNSDVAKIDDKTDHLDSKGKSDTLLTESRECGHIKNPYDVGLDKVKNKKRKLEEAFKVITVLEQDLVQSAAEDVSSLLPCTQSLSKRPKTELLNITPAVAAPPVWSDENSEDNLTKVVSTVHSI